MASTGMFISEVPEARFCGISAPHCTADAVSRSNQLFVRLVAEKVEAPLETSFSACWRVTGTPSAARSSAITAPVFVCSPGTRTRS